MVEFRYSGGANNSLAEASLGGAISGTSIVTGEFDNIFNSVTRVESINNRIDYRMIWLVNNDTDDYIGSFIRDFVFDDNHEISIAIDNSLEPQILQTDDQTPQGLTFYSLLEWIELSLVFQQFNQGDNIPIWFRRRIISSTGNDENVDFKIDSDTNTITTNSKFSLLSNNGINMRKRSVKNGNFLVGESHAGECLFS